MKEIEEIAREMKIFIVTGFIERDDTNGGGTLYCSVAFVSPDHGLLYSRRKVSWKVSTYAYCYLRPN